MRLPTLILLAGCVGCPKGGPIFGENGTLGQLPLDPATALQGVAALAEVGQGSAIAKGDRVQCVTLGTVAFAARVSADVLTDQGALPAGHLDLAACSPVKGAPLTCKESAALTAGLAWAGQLGATLAEEAGSPDGILDWPAVPIAACPEEDLAPSAPVE